MSEYAVAPVGMFELAGGVVRQDNSATFGFYLVNGGVEVELPGERPHPVPNTGTWIMLDVSPN